MDTVNKPLAAPGLLSWRYRARYGYVMIGAKNQKDALREAARSIEGQPDQGRLEVWAGCRYLPVAL